MAGKYLIGIDNGTQSTKVVIYDLAGNVVCEARRTLLPMEHPEPGYAVHPDDDLWESIVAASREVMTQFAGDPADILGVGLCTIRCCKTFLKADGSLLEPVMSWMDTRAYQPWIPDDPELAWATTSSGYITHRFTGEFRDSAANNIILQWPIDTDTWQWDPALFERVQHAPGAARGAADAGRHRRLRDRRRGGRDRHPGGPAGRDHRQRQGGRGARLRLARRAHRPHLAGHLHRLHGARAREPPGRGGLLDQLRLRPAPLPLRERRRAPRHVDAQLVPRPARARARRRGGDPGRSRARSTSSARPSWSPPGAAAS